ncbi:MAG TPA: SurA N-terminal domain-containing protein [Marmoricola sp.]|nr:SurA N-terminal domain-containing protein [Marmoricola sp.]
MKAHRLVLIAVAGASMLALSGCAQSGSVAAHVGDTTVPTSDVDFLTRMQCDALNHAAKDPTQAGQSRSVPIAQIRTGMVNTLVQSELNKQLAEKQHLSYDKNALRSVMSRFESVVTTVPAKDRTRFRQMVEDVYRGQLQVYTLAQEQLAQQGAGRPTQDQVDQAVASIQAKFRKGVDVEVNPQYGADTGTSAAPADPSLSLAVSSYAKQARSSQPDATWVASLPADQRCG